MNLRLIFVFFTLFYFYFISTSNAQTALPDSITVDIVDPNSLKSNSDGNYPIIDLLDENPIDIKLLYPSSEESLKTGLIGNQITDVIVQMPFETYIEGVVLNEVGYPGFKAPLEAQKAQAVASRSFAAGLIVPYKNSQSFTDPNGVIHYYDTIGNTDDQVYTAYVNSNPLWDSEETPGQATSETANQSMYCFNTLYQSWNFLSKK
jgi:peptidoglycan hydrolase-like amidase